MLVLGDLVREHSVADNMTLPVIVGNCEAHLCAEQSHFGEAVPPSGLPRPPFIYLYMH